MPRLIAVSSRVQVEPEDGHASRSGVAVALTAALRESNGFWFGWSGGATDAFTGQITFRRSDGVATATVDLEPQDIEEYANGFAMRTLWPLFHEQPAAGGTRDGVSDGYARLNYRFAETLAPLIESDDVVWVHDFPLIPLGENLRDHGFANRIGFFLHIPWPPEGLLAAMPGAAQLVESMFAYDVIGFQTEADRRAFSDFATLRLGAKVEAENVRLGVRVTRLLVCPMGLDAADFAGAVHSLAAKQAETRLVVSAGGRDMILGVDRLDQAKGLEERFAAYALLLAKRPDLRDKVFLLQIAPPAAAEVPGYRKIRETLDARSGAINGAFASIDWTPLRFVNQAYSRDELFGIYRAARVGLVTPLRDGMNLVAKEYVAAQDPADPGVLVLSRFAGAAAQLTDAVIVDPRSAQDMAEGIARALAMPLAERQERHKAMLETITSEDVRWWSRRFMDALAGTDPGAQPLEEAVTAAGGA